MTVNKKRGVAESLGHVVSGQAAAGSDREGAEGEVREYNNTDARKQTMTGLRIFLFLFCGAILPFSVTLMVRHLKDSSSDAAIFGAITAAALFGMVAFLFLVSRGRL